jgi:hypothetical protein
MNQLARRVVLGVGFVLITVGDQPVLATPPLDACQLADGDVTSCSRWASGYASAAANEPRGALRLDPNWSTDGFRVDWNVSLSCECNIPASKYVYASATWSVEAFHSGGWSELLQVWGPEKRTFSSNDQTKYLAARRYNCDTTAGTATMVEFRGKATSEQDKVDGTTVTSDVFCN